MLYFGNERRKKNRTLIVMEIAFPPINLRIMRIRV